MTRVCIFVKSQIVFYKISFTKIMQIVEVQESDSVVKQTKKKSSKRDKSPKRAIVMVDPIAPPNRHREQCRACGSTKSLVMNDVGDEWECAKDCKNDGNYGVDATNADGSKICDYGMNMYLHRISPVYTKVGILDVLPKICSSIHHANAHGPVKYTWYGMYHIVVPKGKTNDESLQWLADEHFKIVHRKDKRSLVVIDLKHGHGEPIYRGVYPAERSFAMLELGRTWYHCDLVVKHRRSMTEILEIFLPRCEAIAIVVDLSEYIEIPVGGVVMPNEDTSLYDTVERAYSKRESETKKTFACI